MEYALHKLEHIEPAVIDLDDPEISNDQIILTFELRSRLRDDRLKFPRRGESNTTLEPDKGIRK